MRWRAAGRMALAPAALGPDDIAVLQYTGGTTGVSKGAVLLHRNLVANLLQSQAWYRPALTRIPPGEQIVTVCALPLYHVFGFNVIMLLGLHMGGCSVLIPNARDIAATLKELVAPPLPLLSGGEYPFQRAGPPPRLRPASTGAISSSASVAAWRWQQATARLWLEKTGCPICEGYGLSETSPSATCNPVDSTAFSGNIGLPLPGTELTLLDDAGHEVPTGTPGEIAIRGPQVMAGYWQRPDETAKVMTVDGWFPHRRHRHGRRTRILPHRRSQEGHDLGQRFQRLPQRGRGRGHANARGAGMRRRGHGRRQGRRGREADRRAQRRRRQQPHRGRRARLLRSQPHRLQAAQGGGIPQRTAQDAGGQGAAACA